MVSRPSTAAAGEPGADAADSSCVPSTVTMPPETVMLAGPPPAEAHDVFVQLEPSAVPLKSSENEGASWTSPPELLATAVPAVVPAPKSAAVDCVQAEVATVLK